MAGFVSFVVALALSGGLGYLAYLRLQRRDRTGTLRMAALALVPLGLDLAGFVRLGRKVGDAVGHWAINLVFNPLVWIGIIMLGLAALLWFVAGFGEDAEVAAEPTRLSRKQRRAVTGSAPVKARQASYDEDPEIEAILRKHGVS
jgi:hypothetical protein